MINIINNTEYKAKTKIKCAEKHLKDNGFPLSDGNALSVVEYVEKGVYGEYVFISHKGGWILKKQKR